MAIWRGAICNPPTAYNNYDSKNHMNMQCCWNNSKDGVTMWSSIREKGVDIRVKSVAITEATTMTCRGNILFAHMKFLQCSMACSSHTFFSGYVWVWVWGAIKTLRRTSILVASSRFVLQLRLLSMYDPCSVAAVHISS